ncbi:unnamed protein product [Brassica oleracea var. botrytis]|uniref:(rape) hypothetical protein n=1 Tax=Brassica napus TaxID=3708 RepID=A0A816R507_BRANA|nr:unnamed protein product [Brassica napus]
MRQGEAGKSALERIQATLLLFQGGGNHGGDDMPGAGLVSTNPSDRMIRDASDKTTASDSLRVVEGSEADPPLAPGAGVSVGYTTQVSTHGGCA